MAAYLPLAVFGFSPSAFFLIFAAHNLYQFLIHTSYLPEMRLLGKVFNTPYHHELHHARNKAYIDTNFAGIFIIWDKLFGTFAEHTEPVQFGVGQETTTLCPVKGQLTTLSAVFKEARYRTGLKSKLKALFGSPAYLTENYKRKLAQERVKGGLGERKPFSPNISTANRRYAIVLFAFVLIIGTLFRNTEQLLTLWQQFAVLALFLPLLIRVGQVLDGKGEMTLAKTANETLIDEGIEKKANDAHFAPQTAYHCAFELELPSEALPESTLPAGSLKRYTDLINGG